ncbi:hypothetical protein GGS20DRAFT_566973 [Poronia punctata]|nr:hypothetical protein GGS20DRAFT_566973 [Poronia punctata]
MILCNVLFELHRYPTSCNKPCVNGQWPSGIPGRGGAEARSVRKSAYLPQISLLCLVWVVCMFLLRSDLSLAFNGSALHTARSQIRAFSTLFRGPSTRKPQHMGDRVFVERKKKPPRTLGRILTPPSLGDPLNKLRNYAGVSIRVYNEQEQKELRPVCGIWTISPVDWVGDGPWVDYRSSVTAPSPLTAHDRAGR